MDYVLGRGSGKFCTGQGCCFCQFPNPHCVKVMGLAYRSMKLPCQCMFQEYSSPIALRPNPLSEEDYQTDRKVLGVALTG